MVPPATQPVPRWSHARATLPYTCIRKVGAKTVGGARAPPSRVRRCVRSRVGTACVACGQPKCARRTAAQRRPERCGGRPSGHETGTGDSRATTPHCSLVWWIGRSACATWTRQREPRRDTERGESVVIALDHLVLYYVRVGVAGSLEHNAYCYSYWCMLLDVDLSRVEGASAQRPATSQARSAPRPARDVSDHTRSTVLRSWGRDPRQTKPNQTIAYMHTCTVNESTLRYARCTTVRTCHVNRNSETEFLQL